MDAHRDDPEFGYRFLADAAQAAGHDVCDRTVWRICRDNGWGSSFGKPRRRKGRSPGTPAHDDLVRRNFTPEAPNRLWLADITEHPTGDRNLYLCAIQAWAHINPITHIVDADRAVILGGPTATPLLQALAWLTALAALFIPLALRRYHQATQ